MQVLSPTSQHTEPASHMPRSSVMPKRSSSVAHMRTVSTMFKSTTAPPPPPNYHLSFLRLLLQRFPLLTGMHPDSLDDLAHHTRRLATHRGQLMAAEGETPTCVYLIENGAFKLSKRSDQLWDDAAGEYMQVTLAQLSGGEEIGTFSLIAAAKEQVRAILAAKHDEGQSAFRKPPPPSFPPHPLTTTCTSPGHVYAIPLHPLLALTTSRPSLLRHLSTDVLLHHAVHMRRFEGAEQYKMERQGAVDPQFVEAARDAQQLRGTRVDRRQRLPRSRTKRPDHVTAAAVKPADVTWQEEDEDEQKEAAEATAEDKRQKEKDERRRRRREARQKRDVARQQQQADMAAAGYRTADQQRLAVRAEEAWRKDERAVEAEEKEAVREEMKRRWAEGQRETRQEQEMAQLLSAREKKFSEREANQQPIMLKRQEEQERYAIQQLGSPRSEQTPYTHSDDFEQHLQRMHSREAERDQQIEEQPNTPSQQQQDEVDGRDLRGRNKSFVSNTIALINSIARENNLQHIVHPKAQQRPDHHTHTRRQHKTISWSEHATQHLQQQTAAADQAKQAAAEPAAATIPEQSEGEEEVEVEETEEQAESRLASLSTSSFDPLSHLHLIYTPHSSTLLHPTLADGSINPELIRTVEAGNEVFRLSDLQRRSSAEAAEEDTPAFPVTSFFESADARDGEGEDGRGNGRSSAGGVSGGGMSAFMKGALSYAHIGSRSRGASLNDDTANSNLRSLREKRMSVMQAAMDRGEKVLAAAGLVPNRHQRQQDADGSFFVTDQQTDDSGGAGGGRASVAHMRQVSSMLSDPLALASMLTSSSAADLQMGSDEQGDRLLTTIQQSQHQRQQQLHGRTGSTAATDPSLDATHMSPAEYLRLLYARHGLQLVEDVADLMVRDRLGQHGVEALDAVIADGGVLSSKVQAMLIDAVVAVEAEMKRVEDMRAARRPIMEEDEEDEEQRKKVAEKAERKQRRHDERLAQAQEMEARLTAEVSAQLAAQSALSSPTSKEHSPAQSIKYITPTAHDTSSDEDTSETETETEAETASEDEVEKKADEPRTVQSIPRLVQVARLPMPAARMPVIQPRPAAVVEETAAPAPLQPTALAQPATPKMEAPPPQLAVSTAPATEATSVEQETVEVSSTDGSPRAATPGTPVHELHVPSLPSSPVAPVPVVANDLPAPLLSSTRDELPSRQRTAPDRFISTPGTYEEDDEAAGDSIQLRLKQKAADTPILTTVAAPPVKRSSRAQAHFDVLSVTVAADDEADELSVIDAEQRAGKEDQQQPDGEMTRSEEQQDVSVEQSAAVEEPLRSDSNHSSPKSLNPPTADNTEQPLEETAVDEPTDTTEGPADDTDDADDGAATPSSMPSPTVKMRSPPLDAHYLLGENVTAIRKELQKSIADETVKLKEVLEGEEREKAELARQLERRRKRREAAEAEERERVARERKAAEAEERRLQVEEARELAERQAREAEEQQKALESFHASRPPTAQQERPDTAKRNDKLQSFDTTKPDNEEHDAEQHREDSEKRTKGKLRKKGRLAVLLSPRLGTAPSAYSPMPESPQAVDPQQAAEETVEATRAGTVEEQHRAQVHAVRVEVMAELLHMFGAEVRHHLLDKAVQKAATALEEKKKERRQQLKQQRRAETEKLRSRQAMEAAKQAVLSATQQIEEEEAKLLEEEEALKRSTQQRLHQLEEEKVVEDERHKQDEERRRVQAEKRQRDHDKLQEERRLAKEARSKRREEKMRRRITKQLQREQAEANRAAYSRFTSPTNKQRTARSPRAAMTKSPGAPLSRMMTPSSRALQGLTQRRDEDNSAVTGGMLQAPSASEEEKTQLSEQVDGSGGDVQLHLHHRGNKRHSGHRPHHSQSPSRNKSHAQTRRRNNRHQSHDPNSPNYQSDEAEHEDDSFLSHLRTEQDWLHFNPLHPSFTSPDGLVPFDDFDCTAIIDDSAEPSAVLSSVSGGLLPANWYTFVYRDAPASLVARMRASGLYNYEEDEVSEEEREKQRKRHEVKEREQEEDDEIRHSIERRGSLQAYETRQRETDSRKTQQARRKKEKEERDMQDERRRQEMDRLAQQQRQDEMEAFAQAAAKEQETLSLLLATPPTAVASGDSCGLQSGWEAEAAGREVAMLQSAQERLRLRDVSYAEREQREAEEQAAELSSLDLDIRQALDDVQQQRDQQRYSNTQFLPSLSRGALGSRESQKERETGRRQYAATSTVSSTAGGVRSTSPSQHSSDIASMRSPLISRPTSSGLQPLSTDDSRRTTSPSERKQPLQSPKAPTATSASPSFQQKRVAASSILSSQSNQLLSTMSPTSTSTVGNAHLATLPNSMRVALSGQLPFARPSKQVAEKPKRSSFVALDPLTPSKRGGK